MVKCIGAACIVSACIGAGITIVTNHKKEVNSLKNLILAIDYMESELQFCMPSLPVLCQKTAGQCDKNLKKLFLNLAFELEGQVAPDVKHCMESALCKSVDIPDKTQKCLELLGDSLGKFDLDGQLKALEQVKISCEEKLNQLLENANVRLRSYQTLGLCLGAALIILLV